MKTRNEIVEISFDFALSVIEFSEQLEAKKKHIIARQLLKSGYFVHKLKISQKEAEETQYWLLLCEHASTYPKPERGMTKQLLSIQKLLSKIISTTRSKKS